MANLEECITKLAYSGCPWKPKNLEQVCVHTIYGGEDEIDPEDMGFHPNGCCGCVTLGDEEIFGIRCDHLLWLVGGTRIPWFGQERGSAPWKPQRNAYA